MNKSVLFGLLAASLTWHGAANLDAAEKDAPILPTAIMPFEERGPNVKDYGAQVSEILFAELVANPSLYLVDRAELKNVLGEQAFNLTGIVKAEEATQVGQLTGAKLLITGSVLMADKKIFLVAKIIGTETTRVAGASVNGRATEELAPLVAKLAEKIGEAIAERGGTLVAKVDRKDRNEALKKQLGDAKRPAVMVKITERHFGQPTIDPAAQTEIMFICEATGFEVIDSEKGVASMADILITGEGFSETAGRVGPLISVKARVEVKAVDRQTGKVLATDRQTSVVVDLTEQIAGKAALQEAAAILAGRMLPKLVPPK